MKSGKKPLYRFAKDFEFSLEDYSGAHLSRDCDGEFDVRVLRNVEHDVPGIGLIRLHAAPFIACEKCQAAYYAPGFEEFIERRIALSLILNRALLTKPQIRFLRVFFGLTQEQLAQAIGMTDRHYYSNLESLKNPAMTLSEDKQIRLKLFYAEKLGITDMVRVYEIIHPDIEGVAKLDPSDIVPREAELKQAY